MDISDWSTPGNFNNKAAEDCEPAEIMQEVLKQIMEELNVAGKTLLSSEMIEFGYLDRDIEPVAKTHVTSLMKDQLTQDEQTDLKKVINLEPLLVNQCNTWELRPNAYTHIPNFFIASDYVKTNTDLATMEGANEAALRAVNIIIKVSGSNQTLCEIWEMYNPWELVAFQELDKQHYKKGLAWKNKFFK